MPKIRHRRWKLNQQLSWKRISFLAKYTHAKWLVVKEYGIKAVPRIHVLFVFKERTMQTIKTKHYYD